MTETVENIPATLAKLVVPVDGLTPYPQNPRRGDVGMIAESLSVHGQYRPIVVRAGSNEVLAGNHTLAAARELGWRRIAATFVDVDDDTAARIVLVDNRASDVAGYDDAVLAGLLAGFDDLAGTGYDEATVADLLAGGAGGGPVALTDPDDVPEPPVAPVSKPGDLWLLGPHRVMCGDCRDVEQVQRLLDGRLVDVAFTSPPYASQREYDQDSEFRPIPPNEYVDWFDAVQANVRQVLAATGSWFVNIKAHAQDGQRHLYVNDLVAAHVRRWEWLFVDDLCWVDTRNGVPGGWPNRFKDAWEPVFHFATQPQIKFNPLANGEQSDNVFTYSPDNAKAGSGSGLLGGEKRNGMGEGIARPSNVLRIAAAVNVGSHSAPFPVALPAWFMRAYSDPGDLVYDPFTGSGTTIIAADQQDRIAAGMEISPRYVDVVCRRYQEHTGELPVNTATGEPHDFTEEESGSG